MRTTIRLISVIFFSSAIYSFSGCSTIDRMPSCCLISAPNIILTGEKTSVERQIAGDYKELEKNAWIVSSVKSNVRTGADITQTSGDPEMLKAIKIRELHLNKIRTYKDEGAIGEKNNGFIEYKTLAKYEQDKNEKDILLITVDEENKARKTIFERSLVKNGVEPKEDTVKQFGIYFAEEQTSLAKKNDWIQDKTGRWVKK